MSLKRDKNINLTNEINKFVSRYAVNKHEQEKEKAYNLIQEYPYEIKLLQAIGVLFAQNKKLEDACIIFGKILEINPQDVDSLINLGIAYYELNKLDQALKYLNKAKNLNRRQDEIYFILGLIFEKNKNIDKSIFNYNESIKYNSSNVDALINLGNVYIQNKDYDNAIKMYEKAIKFKPNDPNIYHSLGVVFTKLNNFKKAIELYFKSKELNTKNSLTFYNLGYLLAKDLKFDESIVHYKKAINIDSKNPKFYYNLAIAESEVGNYYLAIENYRNALSIDSDYTLAKYNLARLNLATENFSEGWHDFEIRHQQNTVPERVKNILNLKQWHGGLFNGTLFVHGEQGVGDLIIHSSMIEDLCNIQPDICLTVDARFVSLFERSFKDINIKGYDSNLDYTDNDRHIALASLGSFLRKSIADFPKSPEAYIIPNPSRINHFTKILSNNKKIKIGLSWQTTGDRNSERNISLSQMAKFLTLPDVEFINLQYGNTLKERKKFSSDFSKELIDFDNLDLKNDFENLVALMASCDLVITISNITAHVSGAIGKKTWVIVPVNTQWHWFHERKNSLWYPNVELFRQKQYREWKDVIDKIYNKLKIEILSK